jgi:site-specific recombinase XerD
MDEQYKIYTGVKVDDEYWSICAPKKNYPDYEIAVNQINAMQKRVLDASLEIRSKGIDPTVERVRNEVNNKMNVSKPVMALFVEFINAKGIKPGTRRKLELIKNTLDNFCVFSGYTFNIDSWDKLTYGRFIQYLRFHQKLADSTITVIVKGLKAFMKYTFPDKYLPWMKHVIIKTEKKVIALSKAEVQYLIDAELGGYLEKTRDLFVFLATTGMRFSDSQEFDPSWITEKDMLKFRQLKTGNSAYPPLYEVSRRVLLKYEGVPPHISNQKFNVYLKELFEELKLNRPVTTSITKNNSVIESIIPLSDMVSSQLARSTFAALCLESGIGIQYVMQMMGHNDYKSMLPFLKNCRY